MRVVAGSLRGRRLVAPPGPATRPTSDRVREATFNALASLDVVRDATVLDLFAGSGALGIEALTRGAAHCTFVEQARPAIAAVRQNLDALGLSERATVVHHGRRPVPGVGRGRRFDLALADPPYAYDGWAGTARRGAGGGAGGRIRPGRRAAASRRAGRSSAAKRYGTTHVTILRRIRALSVLVSEAHREVRSRPERGAGAGGEA